MELELTSFFGMREYYNHHWLRKHIDREDQLVISTTMCVRKENNTAHWPLEGVDWNGNKARYTNPEGTMLLYESHKLIHGRPFVNPGGKHVGCFAHFKPKSSVWRSEGANLTWQEVVDQARERYKRFTRDISYSSMPSEEPEVVEWTSVKYGDGSRWGKTKSHDDETFPVKFRNPSSRAVSLYWKDDEGNKVHQDDIQPGETAERSTFEGHKFFWSELGSEKPIKEFKVTRNKKSYSCPVSVSEHVHDL